MTRGARGGRVAAGVANRRMNAALHRGCRLTLFSPRLLAQEKASNARPHRRSGGDETSALRKRLAQVETVRPCQRRRPLHPARGSHPPTGRRSGRVAAVHGTALFASPSPPSPSPLSHSSPLFPLPHLPPPRLPKLCTNSPFDFPALDRRVPSSTPPQVAADALGEIEDLRAELATAREEAEAAKKTGGALAEDKVSVEAGAGGATEGGLAAECAELKAKLGRGKKQFQVCTSPRVLDSFSHAQSVLICFSPPYS